MCDNGYTSIGQLDSQRFNLTITFFDEPLEGKR